ILSWTDRTNSQYLYQYDEFNRVTDEGGADGSLRFHFTYGEPDPTTGLKVHTETNALGHTTSYHINERCQVVTQTDPLGNTTHYERDEYHRLLTETDPLGRTTRYEYDGAGDLVTVTRPDGERTELSYAAFGGLPTTITEPSGAVWRQSYDEAGLCTAVTDPVGATTVYGYDDRGHVTSAADALGNVTLIRCDDAGLPVEVTDPTGATTRVQRDALGRIAVATDPLGGTTRFSWTTEGRPASRTAADGSSEHWTYDGEGNLLTHTDQLGQVSTFEYTHFESLAARTGPDGARLSFAYDAHMQLVTVTNALGQNWSYEYDAAGRLIGETDFQQRRVSYLLDPAGRVSVLTNPLGQQVRFGYDALGLPVEKDADGRVTTYQYDLAGRLVRATNPDADLVRTLDPLGRVLTETVNGRTLGYARDVLGRVTTRTTPSGHRTGWDYDTAGRPSVVSTDGGRLDFAYDPAGRERLRTAGDRLAIGSTWDELHRLTGLAVRTDSAALQERHYSYRADGSLSGVDELVGGHRAFDLDPAGRVVKVRAERWTETYAYDPAGNLTHAEWPAKGAAEASLGAREYDGSRLTAAGRVRYEHDPAGRTTLRQKTRLSAKPDTWRYHWDAEDHLTEVTTPDGTRWRYLYDPLGRRIAKLRLAGAGGAVEERTDFSWDGPVLAEQTTRAPYLPGPHTLSWDHNGLQPLAQTETITTPRGASAADDQEQVDRRFFAIVTDLVGTPTELVDVSSGAIAWRATGTLWGRTTWPADSTTYTPLRFPGQYFDPETRLHYNLYRFYDPETARYTSPDPLGLVPGPNPDAYVRNPHSASDPLGLSTHQSGTPYELPLDDKGMPTGGHTWGTERPPLTGAKPNSVHTRTGSNGVPVQNTIYDQNGTAVGHFDFKKHPGTNGPHGHVFDTPGVIAGHGPGAPHIDEPLLPRGWNLKP
ncbi:RHS repeat-associated core domain-containing protein, partial [Kitasatospora viridis]